MSPIVLRQNEDESGVFLDLQTPGAGTRLAVIRISGDLRQNFRLFEERKVPCREVDKVEFDWRWNVRVGRPRGIPAFKGFGYEGFPLGAKPVAVLKNRESHRLNEK